MKKKHLLISLSLMFALGLYVAEAQQTVSSAGASFTDANGSVSYSIGQLVYSAYDSEYGFIIEGVQLPWELFIPNVNIEETAISLTALAYPNPSSDYLYLRIEEYPIDNLQYHLYNQSGKLLNSNKISDTETQISMKELPSAIYFISITNKQQEIKSFKIIKK